MNIGLTCDVQQEYIQRGYLPEETAEFDQPETIDALCSALSELGHTVENIGDIRALAAALVQGSRWDLVFNIAEGLTGFGREAQVPALLDAFAIPYTFSQPHTLTAALHKGFAKALVRTAGVPTPDFRIIRSADDIPLVDLPYPLFVKPVGGGTSMGIDARSRVTGLPALRKAAEQLFRKFRQPVIAESYLGGREFTVGIVGTGSTARAVGTVEIIVHAEQEAGVYTYQAKQHFSDRVRYVPALNPEADVCEQIALQAWIVLEGRDAGRVDVRMDEQGNPFFLEANPLAGLHPDHSDLPIICRMQGISYMELIRQILEAAEKRAFSGKS